MSDAEGMSFKDLVSVVGSKCVLELFMYRMKNCKEALPWQLKIGTFGKKLYLRPTASKYRDISASHSKGSKDVFNIHSDKTMKR